MIVSLIGSGNVATVLGKKIKAAGHHILQVFSQDEMHASELAGILGCDHSSIWADIDHGADIYIIAITDKALMELQDKFFLHQKLAVHTAGSVSKEVLHAISKNYGVIYPLQSLHKEINEFPTINLLVDANTEDNLTLIDDFAKTFADRVTHADDITRLKLHVAAVFVNNFSNHLYALAENYCAQENLNFQLLLPLIKETANRAQYGSPVKMQTGPAIRDDLPTIQKHIELLEKHPALKQVYEMLTASIRRTK